MKTTSLSLFRLSPIALAVMLGLTGFPATADAKPKSKNKSSHHKSSHYSSRDHDEPHHHYQSFPRSGFALSLGTGYAGRGYYYGPPGVPYYYERPDVRYYRSSHDVPRSYGEGYGGSYVGRTASAVQRELSRRGFYDGPIDGDIGPGSRRAITRYQSSHRLPVTGTIDRSLLDSLGLG